MNTKVLQRTDNLKALEVNIKNKWNWSLSEERDGNGIIKLQLNYN